jgi:hypothetical protein
MSNELSIMNPMNDGSSWKRIVGGLMLLTVRGLLLWAVVPIGLLLTWPLVVVPSRSRGVGLGQYLGWLDLNLISAIQRTIARPFFDAPISWTSFDAATVLTHRIGLIDPL